jgi:hypothetical protein
VGAGLALVCLTAAPARAETARAQRDVSFTLGGKQVTCTFSGWSEWDADDVAVQVDFGTDVLDGDRRCAQSLEQVSATLTFRRSGASEDEYSAARGSGPSTSGELIVRDQLDSAVVTHSVDFSCDENAPNPCSFSVVTDPIAVNSK